MNKPGVYVLYGKNDECLYVGSSRHMEYRVKHHEHKKYVKSITYHPCPTSKMRFLENDLIEKLCPKINITRATKLKGEISTTVSLTAADRKAIRKLQKDNAVAGKRPTISAAIRIAVRKATAQKGADNGK
jgi:excinuclease UvrABC nuclease subunit